MTYLIEKHHITIQSSILPFIEKLLGPWNGTFPVLNWLLHLPFRTKSALGHGQFGVVHIGKWRTPKEENEVAIKMLDPTTSNQDDKVKFLQEAVNMAQFKHPDVIQLYDIVTNGEPVWLFHEHRLF